MSLAALALMQTAWIFAPASDRVLETRAFARYEQAPRLIARKDVSVRRQIFGTAAEVSVYERTYLAATLPFIAARGIESGNIFYDRNDIGDVELQLRYRLFDKTSMSFGGVLPGASDRSALERNFPQTEDAFPPLGVSESMLRVSVLNTSIIDRWRFALRGGIHSPAVRFEPVLSAALYALWSTAQDGFAAGPYLRGDWLIDGPSQRRGIVGLMERIGTVERFSLEVMLETSVFSTAMEDSSAIHIAAVWRK